VKLLEYSTKFFLFLDMLRHFCSVVAIAIQVELKHRNVVIYFLIKFS